MSFANRVTHMGPSGAGQATKSCNQVINFAAFMGIAEALNLGRHFGIDVARLPDAIAGGLADSNMLREYHRAATTGENPGIAFLINGLADFYGGHMNPQLRGRLDLLVKDIGVALQLGHETGAAMPLMGMLDAYARILNAEEKS
ncbi:MAG: NAD-binding protein [Hyphomonadaceae bacterium]